MEQMQTGNREYRITKEFESNEFIVLKDAFNRLMDEIMKLKIQSYEKQSICRKQSLNAKNFR